MMDHFQQRLDALQKESKELITQCQESLVSVVISGGALPTRVALALAQRFTAELISSSFPVVCLLDAMLVATAGRLGDTSAPRSREAVVTEAVLKEFWKVALPLFALYHSQERALKDKTLRTVKRWKSRQLLPSVVFADMLVRAIEDGKELEKDALSGPRDRDKGAGSSSTVGLPTTDGEENNSSFTIEQVNLFRAILQGCTSILEKLPPHRAHMYTDLINKEKFQAPTKSALLFFQSLYADLRREAGAQDTASRVAGPATVEPQQAMGSDAREALANLLDRIVPSSSLGASAEDGADMEGSGRGGSAVTSAAIRYTSPLFSDIFQKQSLRQRSGFGELLERRLPSSSLDFYYPKKEETTQRPFRIPAAKQVHGGAVRRWFPSPEQWVAEKDMSNLALFSSRDGIESRRETTSLLSVTRKRERESF